LPAPFVAKVFSPVEPDFLASMEAHGRYGKGLASSVSGPVPGPHPQAAEYAAHYVASMVCRHAADLAGWPCADCLAEIRGKVDTLVTSHQQGPHGPNVENSRNEQNR
jgi:hypothetical protein